MAEIRPFHSVHYNRTLSSELNRLITPPYDVISPREQDAFYNSHPLNIIRLVLGKQFPGDNNSDNRYTRAAQTLSQWLSEKVLVRNDRPGVIVYRMDFDDPLGEHHSIDGIVALVRVDGYGKGKVLPHEKTYKGPKEDQLRLTRACRSNFTPIHALFDDAQGALADICNPVVQGLPDQKTTDLSGHVHYTWTIDDPKALDEIGKFFTDRSLFIADGHHRYETSMAYRDEVAALPGVSPDGGHNYVMMYLTSMNHPGLTILPAHRMVRGIEEFNPEDILAKLAPYFDIETISFPNADVAEISRSVLEKIGVRAEIGGEFGIAFHNDPNIRILTLRDFGKIDHLMDPSIPGPLRRLDVTILREFIFAYGLGMGVGASEGRIEYAPLVPEAVEKALNGEVQASFILNPTRVDQVRSAAELGHKLPHKSTYFYPKLSSGLVLNVFG